MAGEVAFRELSALVSIDRADHLEATPIESVVAEHLTIVKTVTARRAAAEVAEIEDIAGASPLLANAASEARTAGLEDDAAELDRAQASLPIETGLTSKCARGRRRARGRGGRRERSPREATGALRAREIKGAHHHVGGNTSRVVHSLRRHGVRSMSRASAEAVRTRRPIAVISITDPESADADLSGVEQLVGVIRLKFLDTSSVNVPGWEEVFTAAMAAQIHDFVAAHVETVDMFVVHCEAGISRSGAIARSLGSAYGLHVSHEQGRNIAPNRLVLRLMMEHARKSGAEAGGKCREA